MMRRQKELMAADNTCEWLPDHAIFRRWLEADQEVLWIKGNPGSGKSTLVEHILRQNSILSTGNDSQLLLSFFFTARGNDLQKSPLGLFRTILHQLLREDPDSASALMQVYTERIQTIGQYTKKWSWELRDLEDLAVQTLRKTQSNVYLLIDALDECGEEGAISLVKFFMRVMKDVEISATHLHICFSCRNYPIGDRYNGLEIQVQKENTHDIEIFLNQELTQIADGAVNLVATILEKSSGIFQWVVLVVQQIKRRRGRTLAEIANIIEKLPSTLQELYHSLLATIDVEDRQEAFRLLQWICFTKKSLSLADLRYALTLSPETASKKLTEIQSSDNFVHGKFNNRSLDLAYAFVYFNNVYISLLLLKWNRDIVYVYIFESPSL